MIVRAVRMHAVEGGRREWLSAAVECLRAGALVVIPTDTVYGIAADPRAPGAEARLAAAKGRDAGKPIALLAAGIEEVVAFGARLGDVERRLAAAFWPGALTLVLEVGGRLEGFRVPDDAVARDVLRAAGGVLRVSSANLSGEPPACTADEALGCVGDRVDIVLDAGPVRGGVASTVVRVEAGAPRILRAGAIGAEALAAVARGGDGRKGAA